MLFSGNIDSTTISKFQFKNNDTVLFNDMNVPEVINETKFIYTAYFPFNVLKLSVAGEYTCTGIIDDAMNSSFILQTNATVEYGNITIKSKWTIEHVNIYC